MLHENSASFSETSKQAAPLYSNSPELKLRALSSLKLKLPSPMELNSSAPYFQPSPIPPSTRRNSFQGGIDAASSNSNNNPFGPTFSDPLCSLNLRETSEFVRAFPMAMPRSSSSSSSHGYGCHETTSSSSSTTSAQRRRESCSRRVEQGPGTPGRPLFFTSSSPGHHHLSTSRRAVPSKWEDAEKWLRQPSDQGKVCRQKGGSFAEKKAFGRSPLHGLVPVEASVALHGASAEVLLKDKFTDNVEPAFTNFRHSEPAKESFVFSSSYCEPVKEPANEAATNVQQRDIGTEMTPLGSSTTSRCHTPIKSTSPARHNTPASRSGPLVPYNATGFDISELKDCHFAKLELGAQFDSMVINWSSKEEEEEEVSKSLRHFEASGCEKKSIAECRASAWEEEERTKSCIRYQREEAKIQAWVNLESAKAEAQSRKLEVKIQKMRSNLEEKLMRRMASVHKRAEDWRAAAQLHHLQQLKRATEHAHKIKTSTHLSGSNAKCGCFPCNNSSSIINSNLLNY